MMVSPMLQSYQGPTDTALRSNAVEGYTQVSRIGESVVNAFGTRTHSNPTSPTLAPQQRSSKHQPLLFGHIVVLLAAICAQFVWDLFLTRFVKATSKWPDCLTTIMDTFLAFQIHYNTVILPIKAHCLCSRPPSLAVDPYEFGVLPDQFTMKELTGEAYQIANGDLVSTANPATPVTREAATNPTVESKPHFYAWATAYVGMIAVQRKQRSTFRSYVAAETSAPVIVCAAGKGPVDEFDFQFAGVVRSNSVRTVDDGMGPSVDEYFT